MKKVLLAVLCLFLIPASQGCRKMSERDKTAAVMMAVDEALKRYRYDCGHFPPDEVGLKGLVDNPAGCEKWKGPYIEWGIDVTKDFWGRSFIYKLKDEKTVLFTSYGKDGQPGGTGEDEDIILETQKRPKGMM